MIQLTEETFHILKEEFDKNNRYLLFEGSRKDYPEDKHDTWSMILKKVELNGFITGWVNNIGETSRKNKEWCTNIKVYLHSKEYEIFILTKEEFTPYYNMLIVECLMEK